MQNTFTLMLMALMSIPILKYSGSNDYISYFYINHDTRKFHLFSNLVYENIMVRNRYAAKQITYLL